MELLIIEETGNTPEVNFNHLKHILKLKGESRPEEVQKFYPPIIKWLNDYASHLYFLKDKSETLLILTSIFNWSILIHLRQNT